MEFGLSDTEINKINQVFSSFPEIEEVIVYGSRAKGNFRAGSDIDMTLTGKDLNLHLINEVNGKIDDLLMPYMFDLSILKQIKNQDLTDHIRRIGKTFYKKQEKKLHQ
jgi:predicted nucleotidyltransferase